MAAGMGKTDRRQSGLFLEPREQPLGRFEGGDLGHVQRFANQLHGRLSCIDPIPRQSIQRQIRRRLVLQRQRAGMGQTAAQHQQPFYRLQRCRLPRQKQPLGHQFVQPHEAGRHPRTDPDGRLPTRKTQRQQRHQLDTRPAARRIPQTGVGRPRNHFKLQLRHDHAAPRKTQ